jgi:mannopine transport system permease protein
MAVSSTASEHPVAAPPRTKDRTSLMLGSFALTLPALLLLMLLFVLPLGRLFALSLEGGSLTWYEKALTGGLYTTILLRTFEIAAIVTLSCLVIGYPVAFLLATTTPMWRALGFAFVMLPLWTSVLVRTYAWTILLQRNGILNQLLVQMGWVNQPLRLLYTEGAVAVAMTHVLLPFMVLPIWSSLRAIPEEYSRAAYVLGASRWRTFVEIVWPLSRPGVASGSVMVFLLAMGFFVTPALIGGPQQMMMATLVSQQVRELLNWPFAGALVGCLLVVTLGLLLAFNRLFGIDRFVGSK